MTPKEKAEELYDRFYYELPSFSDEGELEHKSAIKCALIAVDEIINNNSKIPGILTEDTMHNTLYWQEVKQEIEKL